MTISTADGISLTDDISEASVKSALNATGDAPVYGLRAFVEFDGKFANVVEHTATYTQDATHVTITGYTDHTYLVGHMIYMAVLGGPGGAGFARVTEVISSSSFKFLAISGTAGTDACKFYECPLFVAKNVSSVIRDSTVGEEWVNMTIGAPDTNYIILPTNNLNTVVSGYDQEYSNCFKLQHAIYNGVQYDSASVSVAVSW